MNKAQQLSQEVRKAIAGWPLASVAGAAWLPGDGIRSVLVGHDPGLSRASEVAEALGLELYRSLAFS